MLTMGGSKTPDWSTEQPRGLAWRQEWQTLSQGSLSTFPAQPSDHHPQSWASSWKGHNTHAYLLIMSLTHLQIQYESAIRDFKTKLEQYTMQA